MAGETPCIPFGGVKNKGGYGILAAAAHGSRLAHRAALAEKLGRPVRGNALHHCDNPPCIKPEHLYEGSTIDNVEDRVSRARSKGGRYNQTHCKHGHALTSENVATYQRESTRTTITARRCMTCRKDQNKRIAERRKAARQKTKETP